MLFTGAVLLASFVGSTYGSMKVPFPQGTVRNCLSYSQVMQYLSDINQAYPEISSLQTIGTSVEGRDIKALCLGECNSNKVVASALINSLHHARESISLMSVMYTLDHIVTAYDTGEDWIETLLTQRKIMFLPVINPDGYVYNEFDNRKMQRKNRRNVCGTSSRDGVDLNRNYPVCYERNDGSPAGSSNPCDDTYRGTGPFSEPETRAVKKIVEDNNFTISLNIHGYGRYMITPWGCQQLGLPPNDENEFFMKLGNALADSNKFKVGVAWDSPINLYSVNGDSADWMYRDHNIYALTPEVGGGGFWVPEGRVAYYSQENIPMIKHAIYAAGTLLQLDTVQISSTASGIEVDYSIVNAGIWHSHGDVKVAFHLMVGEYTVYMEETNVGFVKFKYDRKSGSKSINFDLTDVTTVRIAVYDTFHCSSYQFDVEFDNLPLSKSFNFYEDGQAILATAPECVVPGTPIPPSTSTPPTKKPTSFPTTTSPTNPPTSGWWWRPNGDSDDETEVVEPGTQGPTPAFWASVFGSFAGGVAITAMGAAFYIKRKNNKQTIPTNVVSGEGYKMEDHL